MEHLYKRNKPSQRQLQVGSSIYRIVTEAMQMNEVLYSKFHMISLVGIRMNSGLKQATVLFTTRENSKNIQIELNKFAGYFRKLIASQLNLRFVPDIFFTYDSAAAQVEILEENLKKFRQSSH